jgi:hypothetical protein
MLLAPMLIRLSIIGRLSIVTVNMPDETFYLTIAEYNQLKALLKWDEENDADAN